ncbi:MAG: hypothetical protein GX178_02320 [Acidobacteria bacterium]|nr:hypothetical protein [Thermoanaerobaculia bacterium]NLN10428.1 hypothetical protein [Acidobacteriota bacterium]MBP7813121.1 hypothetical protein [Thermoanaerobaculia bacterium]MBP8845911.1 hypothetical protein [Thermoanaerobaculia bacterium]HPA95782.1 hypothetical protein [Thermoanaerobaculia bacterium]
MSRALLLAALAAFLAMPLAGEEPLRARDLGGARPEAAALALSGGEGGDLRLVVAAWPLPETSGPNVLVVVEADGPSLLRRTESPALPLEWTLYALAADGAVTGFLAEGVRIEGREEVVETGVRFTAALTLPPGPQSLRVLLRHRDSGAFGVRKVELTVEEPARGFLLLPSAARAPWVEVRSARLPDSPSPLLAALLAIAPEALPLARPEGEGELLVWPPPAAPPRVELTVEGMPDPIIGAQLLPGDAAPPVGLARYRLPALPAPPGLYQLSLAGAAPGGLRAALLPGGQPPPARGWPALFGSIETILAADESGPEAPERPAASRTELERSLRNAYLEILAELAAGQPEAAVARLMEHETATVAREPREALRYLDRAQESVIARLGELDPDALLPIADLHRRLFTAHLTAGHPALARQAMARAEAATQRFAARAGTEDRGLAAASLLSLAASLFDAVIPRRAAELAAQAENLVPGHAAALLAQAVVLERAQEHREATAVLDRLLRADPEQREARLRRALLAQRDGSRKGPQRELRALVAPPARDWVAAVAAQELARTLVARGQAEEAVTMLAAAEARLGDAGGLAVARAWAEERAGRRSAALTHLERIPPPSRLHGDSPRRRYGRWPEEALQAERRTAVEAALLRLPALAAALAREPGEGPA